MPMTDTDRYIEYGTFLRRDDEKSVLYFDTRFEAVSSDDHDITYAPPVWVENTDITDDGNYDFDFYWPEDGDEFSIGYPGIYDAERGEFCTLDQWEDMDILVYSAEYTAWAAADRRKARDDLRQMLNPNDPTPPRAVYTNLKGVSTDGCRRLITCHIPLIRGGINEIADITRLVSRACSFDLARNEFGLVVNGCGMDMGFHVVDSLESALGFSIRHEWL